MYVTGPLYTLMPRFHQLTTSEPDINSYLLEYLDNQVALSLMKEAFRKEAMKKYGQFGVFKDPATIFDISDSFDSSLFKLDATTKTFDNN